ncbi:hypothetical protein [Subtercola boreus]|uniref:hypothetical protein n=1 Tax=Subtercola boreus TaxID=120213 RepID=UPI00115288FF|nr:hypothetical protein [Subtercola boreus]TQL53994.1 hypothetical protein FB464_1520 [Subtercola boreus]
MTLSEIRRRLIGADDAERAGDDLLARRLRDEALLLTSAAQSPEPGPERDAAEHDATERDEPRAPAGNGSTSALQSVVDRGHRLAKRPALRRDDVRKLSGSRDEGKRVMGLAIIQKRPELGSIETLVEAVSGSRSTFEVHQGLVAARAAVDARTLDDDELAALREAIRVPLAAGRICGDESIHLARQLLEP